MKYFAFEAAASNGKRTSPSDGLKNDKGFFFKRFNSIWPRQFVRRRPGVAWHTTQWLYDAEGVVDSDGFDGCIGWLMRCGFSSA
jgi:hypothetical protein